LEVTDKYGFLAHDSPAFFVKQRSLKSGRAEIHYLGKATFDVSPYFLSLTNQLKRGKEFHEE